MAVLQLVAVVLAVCSVTSGRLTVCPVNKLQFLSYNTTLLPRTNVKASSESETSNPLDHFITQYAEPWCSDFNDVDNPDLHINFTFTEPVVITFLQSSGFFNAFVDSFSIQHALGAEGGAFMPYGVLQVPQMFHVDHEVNNFQEAYFSLERQVVAERLILKIHHSIHESSNRSCWSLKVLGCTFKEAVTTEVGGEPDNSHGPEPCHIISEGGMMIMNTAYPQPTGLPSEPCTDSVSTNTDPQLSTEHILTIVVPVAVFVVVLCAVMVGVGVLCCYVIVDRKPQEEGRKSKYHGGVTVKVLGRKHIPVPKEPGNQQRVFIQGSMSSRKDSVCSNDSDSFHYDMPRPIMYDVPRTSSQRQRTGTTSSNEYRNPIYDGTSNKESNTYESIPYDFERTGHRTRAASDHSLRRSVTRTRRASDTLPRSEVMKGDGQGGSANLQQAMHSSDPQILQYTVADKGKKAQDALPVFEVLYDQSASKDDVDTPINLSIS